MAANNSGQAFGRRWPWLSRADYAVLQGFTDREQAREFERLLRDQARDEAGYRAAVVTDELDKGREPARWTHGAGGGRRVPRMGGAE